MRITASGETRTQGANAAVLQVRSIRDQITKAIEKVPQRKKAEVQALADSLLADRSETRRYSVR